MPLEISFILFLCMLIVFLLIQRYQQQKTSKNLAQNEKLIQLLLAYPVHQYTMQHMLERCLVMIFSSPQLNLLPLGAFYLQDQGTFSLTAHRGINDFFQQKESELLSFLSLADLSKPNCEFITLPSSAKLINQATQKGYYLVPLIKQKKQIATLILFSSQNTPPPSELTLISSISNTLGTLIENKLFSDELRLGSNLMHHSHQSIFITDKQHRVLRCNISCEKVTGYQQSELVGNLPIFFKDKLENISFYSELCKTVDKKGIWQGEVWSTHKNSSRTPEWLSVSSIKDENDNTIQYLAIFTNLSTIKSAQQEIQKLSYFDPLTNLANRTSFNHKLAQTLTFAERQETNFSLVCIDIDHFKKVNDSLGQKQGDELLKIFAQRILNSLRKTDSVFRLDGNEFAVIINHNSSYQIAHITEKILAQLRKPVTLSSHEFSITASIGISCYPTDTSNSTDLTKYAGLALQQVKQDKGDHYQFYNSQLNTQSIHNLKIESALRSTLANHHFEIFFQPQLHLQNNTLTGAEVLLRSTAGELKNLSPAIYIPVAEETGLIIDIGDWVFTQTCLQLKIWQNKKILAKDFNRIAINISPAQFNRPDFIKKVQNTIKSTGVDTKHLEIELTESALQESTHFVIEKLNAIKALGINIAIDDFGTGYSSLSRLKALPIDLLKIDRAFVTDICNNHEDLEIITAIIKMASALNIDTLAEGIEKENQAITLKELSCNFGQGFLFSKAIDAPSFTHSLISSNLTT